MNAPKTYLLKLASKKLQTAVLISLLLFCLTLFMPAILTDFSPTALLHPILRYIVLSLIIFLTAGSVIFTFYTTKVTLSLNDSGIQIANSNPIAWEDLQWYRIDLFSSSAGIRRLVLKYTDTKVVMLVQDTESLDALLDEIKQQIRMRNLPAKDFRELRVSRRLAVVYICLVTAIYLVIGYILDFEKNYMWPCALVLLFIISAILLEHIKDPEMQA